MDESALREAKAAKDLLNGALKRLMDSVIYESSESGKERIRIIRGGITLAAKELGRVIFASEDGP